MLLHKEPRLIDWIRRQGVVLSDIQRRSALRGQRSSGWIAESQVYRASSRNVPVVDDQHGESLAGFTRRKTDHAVSCRVVFPLFRRAVTGRVANRCRA